MKLEYGDVAMSAWTSYRVCGLFMDVVQTNNGIYRKVKVTMMYCEISIWGCSNVGMDFV